MSMEIEYNQYYTVFHVYESPFVFDDFIYECVRGNVKIVNHLHHDTQLEVIIDCKQQIEIDRFVLPSGRRRSTTNGKSCHVILRSATVDSEIEYIYIGVGEISSFLHFNARIYRISMGVRVNDPIRLHNSTNINHIWIRSTKITNNYIQFNINNEHIRYLRCYCDDTSGEINYTNCYNLWEYELYNSNIKINIYSDKDYVFGSLTVNRNVNLYGDFKINQCETLRYLSKQELKLERFPDLECLIIDNKSVISPCSIRELIISGNSDEFDYDVLSIVECKFLEVRRKIPNLHLFTGIIEITDICLIEEDIFDFIPCAEKIILSDTILEGDYENYPAFKDKLHYRSPVKSARS